MKLRDICRFLESLFVDLSDGMGCLRESPNVERDRCYTNTNWLALHALEMCGSNIVSKSEAFLQRYNRGKGRLRILLLHDIPLPPRDVTRLYLSTRVTPTGETIVIYADVVGDKPMPDWLEYVDNVMLAALQEPKNGGFTRAEEYRDLVRGRWVGIGFVDKAYQVNGFFETYKLGLYYFLVRALKRKDDVTSWIEGNIGRLVIHGGVVIHYGNNLEPRGDPNVETTAVIALAFYSNYPDRLNLIARYGSTGGS